MSAVINSSKVFYNCELCDRPFLSKLRLKSHKVLIHGRQSRYKCAMCDTYWCTRFNYRQHLSTHSKHKYLIYCRKCDVPFKTYEKLKVHEALVHYKRTIQGSCKTCWKTFSHIHLMLNHKCCEIKKETINVSCQVDEKIVFSCPHCTYECRSFVSYVVHCHKHHPQRKSNMCMACDENYSRIRSFKSHVLHYHSNYNMLQKGDDNHPCYYVCRVCGHRFANYFQCKNHQKQHRGRCDKCLTVFENWQNYEVHVLCNRECSIVYNTKERVYSCEKCGKAYTQRQHLIRHFKSCAAVTSVSTFSCQICKRSFQTEMTLRRHTKACKREWRCPICNLVLPNGRKYKHEAHLASHKMKEMERKCEICQKIYYSLTMLRKHCNENEACRNGVKYQYPELMCQICGVVGFNSRIGYKLHVERHDRKCPDCGRQYTKYSARKRRKFCMCKVVCKICGMGGFSDFKALIQHKKEEHYMSYTSTFLKDVYRDGKHGKKCPDCDTVFFCRTEKTFRINYARHVKYICVGGKVCPFCGEKDFTFRYDFNKHIYQHDPKYLLQNFPTTKIMCMECFNTFPTENILQKHYIEKPLCGQNSGRNKILNVIKAKNVCSEGKFFKGKCKNCNAQFCVKGNKKKLDLTMNYHDLHRCVEGKVCHYCGEGNFRFKKDYNKHIYQHDAQYLFDNDPSTSLICLKCFQTFQTKRKLKTHQEVSCISGNKSFPCPECDKVYGNKRSMIAHLRRVHTNQNTSTCQYCGKQCDNQSLKQHERTHTGETPFSCKNCGKKFKSKCNLRYHEKKQGCIGFCS